MEQIYTLFCSFTSFILDSWMFNAINSSLMKNFLNIQEFSWTPENILWTTKCFSRIKDKTRFNSKFKDNYWHSRTSGNHKFTMWHFRNKCAGVQFVKTWLPTHFSEKKKLYFGLSDNIPGKRLLCSYRKHFMCKLEYRKQQKEMHSQLILQNLTENLVWYAIKRKLAKQWANVSRGVQCKETIGKNRQWG